LKEGKSTSEASGVSDLVDLFETSVVDVAAVIDDVAVAATTTDTRRILNS
jgi:hypothetical protein